MSSFVPEKICQICLCLVLPGGQLLFQAASVQPVLVIRRADLETVHRSIILYYITILSIGTSSDHHQNTPKLDFDGSWWIWGFILFNRDSTPWPPFTRVSCTGISWFSGPRRPSRAVLSPTWATWQVGSVTTHWYRMISNDIKWL